ncbi:MAG: hypothetical protein CO189_03575 [candidate division Zixibacteria bacterium CG_4_9_14_3_um_filter_46_8]|nr:MAG: hypothetical protein CO189_03575 [candidate division Zixibacteria bacterium CG_4_9_14_3_um_filter_46_8]
MYQDIDENVDMIALFNSGKVKPIKFRWKDRPVKVVQVTGKWKSDVGRYKVRHFAVVDDNDNFFQLAYDERDLRWTLEKIWVE